MQPAWQGMATGFLLLLGFALPPLAALRNVAPARVLRRVLGSAAWRAPAYLLGVAVFFLVRGRISGALRLNLEVAGGFVLANVCFGGLAYDMGQERSLFEHRSM